MAFRGVFEAPKIMPSAFGLFDLAKPETGPKEDQWTRGFSQEWDTQYYSAKNIDDTDTTLITVSSNATPTRYDEIKPFFIEVEDYRSTLGLLGVDPVEKIKKQLEGITQHAIEKELWDGGVRIGETHANRALVSPDAYILNSGTALSPRRALALLEFQIGSMSPAGEQGVIHMTRDVAALLSSNSQMLFHEVGKDHLQTMGGTPVIIGGGYSGAGPTDAAGSTEDPTATNKWMYATGTVKVILGDIDVVTDNLAQGYDVSGNQNNMRLKAIRPAAVYFDTSVHIAVRVDLTA
jgi:hypothetical protein